jgi:kynurenine 3-monooxygenase
MGGAYLNRYQLVTFTRVPYREALQAGRIQQEILRELCAGATTAAEVDYERGQQLVRERLAKLLARASLPAA